MADEETDSLELVPIEVWHSREALDADAHGLEEVSHVLIDGGESVASATEDSEGGTASASEADNFANEMTRSVCVIFFQPWLVVAFVLCVIVVALGGVSVFTNSWAHLNDTHVGLFTTCNASSSACVEHGVAECTRNAVNECYEARYGIHAAAILALTGFILSGFALIFVLLAWISWFFTFMSSTANFCTGVIYLAAVIVFSAADLRLLNLSELAVEDYSFALCVCSVIAAFLSGGFTLQALSWQLSKFDKRAFLNQLK